MTRMASTTCRRLDLPAFFEYHSSLAGQDGLKVTLGPRLTRFQASCKRLWRCRMASSALFHEFRVITGLAIGGIAEVLLPLLGRQVPRQASTGLGDEVLGAQEVALQRRDFIVHR
jgi:hypothetical protein